MIQSIFELENQCQDRLLTAAADILFSNLKFPGAFFEIDNGHIVKLVVPVSHNYDMVVFIYSDHLIFDFFSPNIDFVKEIKTSKILEASEFLNSFILVYKTIFSS